jgi:radical SAM superfamily enzyme YgiQ (UPF0313 family)
MKVLLISENRSTTLVAPFPLGLAFVAGSLRQAHHDVRILDLMFLDDWEKKLCNVLAEFRPEVIGLSIRNIDNQDAFHPLFFLDDHREIVKLCRGKSDAAIVVGGAGFNIHPSGCLEYIDADWGIFGEGEQSFPTLLEAIEKRGTFEQIPGIVWRKNGRVIVNLPRFIAQLDKALDPCYDDFDLKAYHNDTTGEIPGCITVQNKRGCHMRCIYCSTPRLEGRQSRIRNTSKVVSEISYLSRERDIQRFYLVDNVFNFPVSEAKNFCREILVHGLTIQWQAIINPAFGDKELFELMSKGGCRFISIGNESGVAVMLRNLKKGFTLKNIEKTAGLARDYGMRYGCFLLLGGPGETPDTVKQSIEFVEALSPDRVTVKAGIRIYPGTKLEELALSEGLIRPDQELLHPAFYLSQAVKDWIYDYLEEVCRDRPKWNT